jgi:hypothetical protein
MKNLFAVMMTLTLVAGCGDDSLYELYELDKGSLDAVTRCQEKNESKTEILGGDGVLRACIKKNAETTYYLPRSEGCSAYVILNESSGKITFDGNCGNASDMLITGITAYIDIENFPQTSESGDASVTSVRLTGNNDEILVAPGQKFTFTIEASMKDEVADNIDSWAIPYCSADDSVMCRTWGFSSFRYIDPNI